MMDVTTADVEDEIREQGASEPVLTTTETPRAILVSKGYLMSGRKFSSLRPNHLMVEAYVEAVVDGRFEDAEEREETEAILNDWTFKPWKGCVWVGPDGERKRWDAYSVDEHGQQERWDPCLGETNERPPIQSRVYMWGEDAPLPVIEKPVTSYKPLGVDADLLEKLSEAGRAETAVDTDVQELNLAFEAYALDPEGAGEQFWTLVYGYIRVGWRLAQCRRLIVSAPETALGIDDILTDFYFDLRRRIESGQYTHFRKMTPWIDKIWNAYFFPGVKKEFYKYLDKTRWVNNLETEDDGYKFESYCVNTEIIPSDQDTDYGHVPMTDYWSGRASLKRLQREVNDPSSPFFQLKSEAKQRLKDGTLLLTSKQLGEKLDVTSDHAKKLLNADIEAFESFAKKAA